MKGSVCSERVRRLSRRPRASELSLAFCPRSLLAALFFGIDEPNRPLGRIGWRHELAQGVEDLLEVGSVVSAEGVVVQGRRLEAVRRPVTEDADVQRFPCELEQ